MTSTHRPVLRASALLAASMFAGCVNEPAPSYDVQAEEDELIIREITPLVASPNLRTPETDAAFRSVEASEGRLILTFNGSPSQTYAVGSIVGGMQSGGYSRRVTAVRDLGDGRIELTTEEASLQEAFPGGELEVAFEGPFDVGDGLTTEDARWSLSRNGMFNGNICDGQGSAGIEVVPDFTYSFQPNARIRLAEGEASVSLRASAQAGVTVSAAGQGSVACAADLTTFLSPAALERLNWHWERTMPVRGFPIRIVMDLTPTARFTANGNLNTGTTQYRAVGRAGLNAGLSIRSPHFTFDPSASFTQSFNAAVGGAAHVDANVRVGLQYSISIGTSILSIGGQATATATIGAVADTNGCTWSARGSVGAQVGVGLTSPLRIGRDFDLFQREFMREGRVRACGDVGPVDAARVDAGAICTARNTTPCTSGAQCCGTDVCQPNGGRNLCCVEYLQACSSDADCCGAMTCGTGGVCRRQPSGATCERTADCAGFCTEARTCS